MQLPKTILALGITVPYDDPPRARHIAHLAGRIGYGMAWVPVAAPIPVVALRDLAAAAAPAQIGLLLDDDTAQVTGWLEATVDDPILGGLPLECAGTSADRDLLSASLGPGGYATRVYTRELDLAARGCVVAGPDEPTVVERLGNARSARARAGYGPARFELVVDAAVAIGRTMGEAEARRARDARLASRDDLRTAGLFGTFEDAQSRVLAYAGAGADGIRATVAEESDVADLLAHLRAVTVGPVAVLHARGGGASVGDVATGAAGH